MTTDDAALVAVDILLASAAVALIGLAAWLVIKSRHAPTGRLFGRTVHHPRLWAAGAACMGFYVLLWLGNLTEVTPSAWHTASRWIGAALFLAALALMASRSVLEHRARRRHGREQHTRP
ncbi:hypothetical protein [Micromonospora nigra]|uniref:hypothetical protein n=1 Tax=Micromonospora nigra TaxID=145857 RepID=UPI000B85DC69|nr:hypothetical protein [Micromonospora nigra]